MKPTSLSVIIPCFNEEQVIEQTYQRVKNVLDKMDLMSSEIIFINDGSRDNTFELLKNISVTDSNVKLINFSRNFGHQPAVTAGIHNALGDIAIIIDADLQDPPELFPDMLKVYIEQNCSVVYAVRKTREGEGWFKKITAKYFYKLINYLSETSIPLDTGDFRLIDRHVMDEFKKLKEGNKFIRGIISWIGFKQVPFYYDRNERAAGETKYPLRKMLRFAINGILYFSKKPLKICVAIGLFCTLLSLLFIMYVLYGYFFTDKAVSGWASTLIIVIFFSGIQLLSLGLVAQYIANIFDEVKNRPEYIVAEKINF